MGGSAGYERPGVAGSGLDRLRARRVRDADGQRCGCSPAATPSAWRAEENAQGEARKLDRGAPERIKVTTDPADLADCDLIVEAIAEDADAKAELLATLGGAAPEAHLATTTSSLSIAELARARRQRRSASSASTSSTRSRAWSWSSSACPRRSRAGIADRARAWCAALGKTAIEVPDQAGFVVNRLLFPYLFEAVRLMESSGMAAEDVDSCMQLGAGHPMGPLRLLDFVGLDVAAAIGESLDRDGAGGGADVVPELIARMVAAGKLGRKSGEGFFEYR